MTSDFQRVADALGLLDDLDHWHAASNIERAFLVVAKMKARGFRLDMRCYPYNRTYAAFYDADENPFFEPEEGVAEGNGDHCDVDAIIAAAAKALESAAKEKPA